MPDIAKCQKSECPRKSGCYRFTALPNPIQQVYLQPNFDKDGNCYQYLPNTAPNSLSYYVNAPENVVNAFY